MSERLELPSSLAEGGARESVKPSAGALAPTSLTVKKQQQFKVTVLEGEKSFFCLLEFNSLCFPNRFAVHKRMFLSDAVQSHHSSSLVPEGMADATKGNGNICKGANSSRGFRARLAKQEGHLCNTCQRNSLMTKTVQDAVLPSINGTSRASKSSPLGSPYSWSPMFDSQERVPKLMAFLNEQTHNPHYIAAPSRLQTACTSVCISLKTVWL